MKSDACDFVPAGLSLAIINKFKLYFEWQQFNGDFNKTCQNVDLKWFGICANRS